MQSIDDRVMELEKEMAVIREIVSQNIRGDEGFQKEIRTVLDYLKERNSKVDMFIEDEIQARKDKADFWRGQKEKLAASGFFGALSLLAYVIWYAITQYVHNPTS